MSSDLSDAGSSGGHGLWLPPGAGNSDFDAAYPEDMKPRSQHHVEDKWTLQFPVELGGLFAQVSMVKRPTQGSDYQTTFGITVARFYAGFDGPDDPGYLTKEEFKALIGHMQTALEDSEG